MTSARLNVGLTTALAGLLLTAGACASSGRSPTMVLADVPCLPPGIAATFLTWPVVDFKRLAFKTEDDKRVPATWVLYQRRDVAIAAIWNRTDLLAVDPSPETETPEWIDGSLFADDELTLRTNPEAPCQWRRHSPREHASGTAEASAQAVSA